MLILLAAFIFLLVFIGWIGGLPVSVTIPAASLAVSAEVAKELANTAIPDYVLTYGISPTFPVYSSLTLFKPRWCSWIKRIRIILAIWLLMLLVHMQRLLLQR